MLSCKGMRNRFWGRSGLATLAMFLAMFLGIAAPLGFVAPAWAQQQSSSPVNAAPQDAPRLFFEAMYRMDYVQAWQLLTIQSQDELIRLIQKTEQKTASTQGQGNEAKTVNTEVLKRMFNQGERPLLRGFWTQMRQSMGIETWHGQTFTLQEQSEDGKSAFVRVMPAKILLFVKNENNTWKLGYVESFVERRLPSSDKDKKDKQPSASPSPKKGAK